MLYRFEDFQEGYIHICDDAHKYNRKYLAERPRVAVHDISAHMIINNKLINIDYCPYCGAKLENEISKASGKFYEF